MVDLDRVISSAMKTSKALLGSKQTVDVAKSGRAAALIVSSNCPTKTLVDVKRYSELSKIPLYVYPASSIDLGAACGKPFAVSALAIRETNDPEVLKMRRELSGESGS